MQAPIDNVCFIGVGSQAWMPTHPGCPGLAGVTALIMLVVRELPGVTPGLNIHRCDVLVGSHGARRGIEPLDTPPSTASPNPLAEIVPSGCWPNVDKLPAAAAGRGEFSLLAVLMIKTAVRAPPSGFVQTSTCELFPSPVRTWLPGCPAQACASARPKPPKGGQIPPGSMHSVSLSSQHTIAVAPASKIRERDLI